MTILKNFLTKNKACSSGFEYAKDMTLTEFYNNCNRGDWIIWLFSKTNPNDSKAVVLAAAHCANACRHLLEDEGSLKAIDAAMNFESYSEKELREIASNAAYEADAALAARYAADAARYAARAARAARADAAYYADNAALAARYAADAARAARADADAAYYADNAADAARYAADAAYYADNAARAARADAALAAYAAYANALRDNKLIADIVRKHLPLEIWNQEIINNK